MSVQRNTAYNIAGAAIPLVATVLAVPPYLDTIGEARYGVLVVLWTLLGYLGLFDMGLGRAVTNRIAALGAETPARRESVFWTALGINLALGTVIGLALWAVAAVLFDVIVEVPAELSAEVSAALPWATLAFPLLLASSVMTGALMGREEFLHQNAVRVGEGALVLLAPLAVAVTVGPELRGLVLAVLAVRTASSLVLFALCVRRLPTGLRPRLDRAEVRPLFVYGGWVTVTSTISPLLSTLDRVLIGAIAGVQSVAYYSVPYGVVTQVTILPGSLTSALFPRFSSTSDVAERGALQEKGLRTVSAVVTPIVVVAVLAVQPAIEWWIDPAFAALAGPVGVLLLPGVWFNCLAYVPYAKLQGSGRPDLVAKAHAAELVPYLALLWLALHTFGAAGAAAVWSVRTGADLLVLSTLSRVPRHAAPRVLVGGALVALALGAALMEPGLAARAGLAVVLAAAAFWNGASVVLPLLRRGLAS